MRRGVETLALSLANELARREVQVSILTARQTQAPLVAPSPQVRVKQFPTFRYYEAATIVPFYVADLAREKYDVVVVFFSDFGEGLALRLAAPFASPRMILYLTFPYEGAPHRYHAYERWGWGQRADRILADAAYTARRGEEFFKRPVQVLPSGTDPDRFKPDPGVRSARRRQLGLAESDVVLLNVAALEERKGIRRVIEALPQIRANVPNVRYLVLGEGAQKAELQRRVEELALTDWVTFAGTTADLAPYYNAADIFVMLPNAEAGSVACLEAMASGLPVVVSNTGGFAEAVDERTGRIVDPSNQAAIASALTGLAQDSVLRENLGQAARRRVIEQFSWEQIGEQLEQMCRQEAAK